MAPATLYDGVVWFVRPLLGSRATPARVLVGEGLSWIDDPTMSRSL
jgi:tRNA(Ile)-lysidine synthase